MPQKSDKDAHSKTAGLQRRVTDSSKRSVSSVLHRAAHLISGKVSSIEDTAQKELREVDITGTLSAGEKTLADLRKRKLIVQRFGALCPLVLSSSVDLHAGKVNGSRSGRDRVSAPQPQSQRLTSL